MSAPETIALLDTFGVRLPGAYAFSLAAGEPIPASHPLSGEITAALDGRTASFPYTGGPEVLWVTIAPTADELRRIIEDLRCWVLPSFGWEAQPAVISGVAGSGPLSAALLAHSPQGYFRWHSRPNETAGVIARLALMRSVIGRAPPRLSRTVPTLESLRRRFTVALATGDQSLASAAIDEIDHRQLDTAINTLGMRIRLAASTGDDRAIVEHPQLDDLLSTRLPRRVVEAVLIAHHTVYLSPFEEADDLTGALDAYELLADRLAGLADTPEDGADAAFVRMAAYDAAVAEKAELLQSLARRFAVDPVVAALAATFPDPTVTTESEAAPAASLSHLDAPPLEVEIAEPSEAAGEVGSDQAGGWADVPPLIAASAYDHLSAFLQRAALAPEAFDPGDGDVIIELFVDDAITQDEAKLRAAERVLTAIIDAYICEERFPRRERLPLYRAVLDVWSTIRADSSDPVDGQLHLTMADALLRLDGTSEPPVATAITRWWEARPVRARLAWLGEALELLTDQSISQQYLTLWYDGARLIKADAEGLSHADRYLWHRLGRRLGLDGPVVDNNLGSGVEHFCECDDPLEGCDFAKIAIVSLHERAAREAAAQIEARTNANVIVVTDHAAGDGTASASTADVILFVWGATKHAVYRAFDKVRDRIEYVQGTGSSSIVRALERRTLRSVS